MNAPIVIAFVSSMLIAASVHAGPPRGPSPEARAAQAKLKAVKRLEPRFWHRLLPKRRIEPTRAGVRTIQRGLLAYWKQQDKRANAKITWLTGRDVDQWYTPQGISVYDLGDSRHIVVTPGGRLRLVSLQGGQGGINFNQQTHCRMFGDEGPLRAHHLEGVDVAELKKNVARVAAAFADPSRANDGQIKLVVSTRAAMYPKETSRAGRERRKPGYKMSGWEVWFEPLGNGIAGSKTEVVHRTGPVPLWPADLPSR